MNGENQGLKILLNQALPPPDSMPMLELMFDRLKKFCVESLRNETSYIIDVADSLIQTQYFDKVMEENVAGSLLVIIKLVELESYGLMIIEAPLVYLLIDILFGGKKTIKEQSSEPRAFTSIEHHIITNISKTILSNLSKAFEPVGKITFALDRIEMNQKFANIVNATEGVINLSFQMLFSERGGKCKIILPLSSIDKIKPLLSKPYSNHPADPVWQAHIAEEIGKAVVQLSAELSGLTLDMKNVAEFEVGKTVLLNVGINTPWQIKLDKLNIGEVKPGKKGGNIAIQLISENVNIRDD
jgi:flagellar motor switch protein FliM